MKVSYMYVHTYFSKCEMGGDGQLSNIWSPFEFECKAKSN